MDPTCAARTIADVMRLDMSISHKLAQLLGKATAEELLAGALTLLEERKEDLRELSGVLAGIEGDVSDWPNDDEHKFDILLVVDDLREILAT